LTKKARQKLNNYVQISRKSKIKRKLN